MPDTRTRELIGQHLLDAICVAGAAVLALPGTYWGGPSGPRLATVRGVYVQAAKRQLIYDQPVKEGRGRGSDHR